MCLYNNAAKIFDAEGVLCRRFVHFSIERHLKQAEGVDYQHLPLGDFFCYFFVCVEDCVESEVIRNLYKFDYLSSVRDNHDFISLCF